MENLGECVSQNLGHRLLAIGNRSKAIYPYHLSPITNDLILAPSN